MTNFDETKELLENSTFYYIIVAGMDGNYSYVNPNYAKAFSHVNKQMVGMPYYITMHPDDRKVCEETAAKCFQSPDQSFPATIRKHDGKGGYIVTQWEYRAMFNEQNEPAGIFCLGHDITEFSIVNQQLRVAVTEVEQKRIVLQQIGWEQSHVLRKPVANIIGLVSILSKMELDQNLSNIISMLTESSNQLDEAINNIVKKTS